MFRELFCVQLIKHYTRIFQAYFEDEEEARQFAEKKAKEASLKEATLLRRENYCVHGKKASADGSFRETWKGEHFEILMDNESYIKSSFGMFALMPYGKKFPSLQELREFIELINSHAA